MTAPKLTEAQVVQLLRERCTDHGNGGAGRYAFLPQVRNAAGFDATRTFDAVAVDLWPSRGLTVDIFEIKVSRSDWQRELRKPDKAEDACKVADRFWIVAPAGCVKPGELPPTWGLIEVRGAGTDDDPWRLRTKTSAPLLHDGDRRDVPLPRGLVVGMLRAAPGAVPGGKVPSPSAEELAAARRAGYAQGKADAELAARALAASGSDEHKAQWWDDLIRGLVDAGVDEWRASSVHTQVDLIVRALRSSAASEGLRLARTRLQGAHRTLGNVLAEIEEVVSS